LNRIVSDLLDTKIDKIFFLGVNFFYVGERGDLLLVTHLGSDSGEPPLYHILVLTPKTKKMAKTTFTFVKTLIAQGANVGTPIYLCVAGIEAKKVTAKLNGDEVTASPGVSFILDDKLQNEAGRDLLQAFGAGVTRERLIDDVTIFARGARNTFIVDLDYDVDIDSAKDIAKEDSRSPDGFRIYTTLTFAAEDKVFDGLQEALIAFKKEMAETNA
jgi:hypothetical protein|tara:strand:- start:13 stop:657 length:645 start_codon:yes stop_codon:yes gene_type:complete